MRRTQLFYLFAILIIILASGIYASAQSNITVSIQNISGEGRKICFYNIDDKAGIIPKVCFTMNKNEVASWENKDRTDFMVKVFKPAVFDEYLYTRRLPNDTNKIIVGEGGRFGFGRAESKTPPTRYFLKVCNQQWDQKIYFVLGFENNKGFWTQGWWNLEKGKCLNFPVSEMMKSKWGIEYGYMPNIYYYAKTAGEKPLEWRGGDGDYNLCINMSNVFEKKQFETNANSKQPLPCDGTSDKFVRFRRLPEPKTNIPTFELIF